MTRTCVLKKCESKKNREGCRFFKFPSESKSTYLNSLSSKRRKLWFDALKLEENFQWKFKYVCSLHFASGQPAKTTDVREEDWIPSKNLPVPDDISCTSSSSSSTISSLPEKKAEETSESENEPLPETDDNTLSSVDVVLESTQKLDCSGRSTVEKNRADRSFAKIPQAAHSQTSDSNDYDTESFSELCDEEPDINEAVDLSGCSSELNRTVDRSIQVGDSFRSANETFQQYYKEMLRLQDQCYEQQKLLESYKRGIKFLKTDAMCNYFTGIESVAVLEKLFEYLEPSLDDPHCKLTTDQMFVMTLTKLRLNSPFASLAYDYDVCDNTISKYFHRTLYILYQCCKWAIEPTPASVLLRHTPKEFKQVYGDRRIFILDCFEVRCETPGPTKAAASHYSNYKKGQTIKFLIAAHPDGTICFISNGFGGRCSDKEVVVQSGFLDCVKENDVVLADKGFNIADLLHERKAILNIPTFLRSKKQFTPSELVADKQITALRIHIERMIGMLRSKYKTVHDVMIIKTLVRFQNGMNVVDLVVRVACILCNLNKSII